MGVCGAKDVSGEERDRDIEEKQQEDELVDRDRLKALLLGPGESGKSTICQQLIKLWSAHGPGSIDVGMNQIVNVIRSSIIESLFKLLQRTQQILEEKNKEFELDYNQLEIDLSEMLQKVDDFEEKEVHSLDTIWRNEDAQRVYNSEIHHYLESLPYFCDKLEEAFDNSFEPSFDDILHCRMRTTGIREVEVDIVTDVDETKLLVVDVGGQRNERKKWINCFDDVDCVIFVASLTGYCQTLFEDAEKNRLVEALDLFEEVMKYNWISNASVVLLLNKVDLFREILPLHPFVDTFGDYEGENEEEPVIEYIKESFRAKSEQKIYAHVTCAIDTEVVEHVFTAIKDTVLRRMLSLNLLF